MKNLIIISLLLISSISAQPSRQEGLPAVQSLFHSETIIIPGSDNNFNLFYTYKIPYNRLVFERDNGEYSAGLRVLVEVNDSELKLIERDIKDTELTTPKFETTSDQGVGLLDFLKW